MTNKKRKKVTKRKSAKTNSKRGSLILSIIGVVILIGAVVGVAVFMGNKPENNKKKEKNSNQGLNVTEQKKVNIVDLNSKSRNIAVMINNISAVWGYQSGIQDAYIVYEIITEGGITRLMGIFRDANTANIGSIRSSREYYVDYVLENDAIYVHDGGSPEALSDIKKFNVTDIGTAGSWRDKSLGIAYVHTEFTSMKNINAKIASKKVSATSDKDLLFNYSADAIDLSQMEGAIPASNVSINYSGSHTTSFEYDKETGVYKRFQNKKAHTDHTTKQQYTAKNIITYQIYNYTYDTRKGRQRLENVGTGEGYYISNGYAVPITWEKSSRSAQTVYRYKNGQEITLNDGNTYIEIQPKNRTITIN